jgi:hypothetical protein
MLVLLDAQIAARGISLGHDSLVGGDAYQFQHPTRGSSVCCDSNCDCPLAHLGRSPSELGGALGGVLLTSTLLVRNEAIIPFALLAAACRRERDS